MKKLPFTLICAFFFLGQAYLQAQAINPFLKFPWLTDIVDPNNCSTEQVAVYEQGTDFVLVTDASGTAILYNEEGRVWCTNAPNYDCVAAYRLSNPAYTWSCDSECLVDFQAPPVNTMETYTGVIYSGSCGNYIRVIDNLFNNLFLDVGLFNVVDFETMRGDTIVLDIFPMTDVNNSCIRDEFSGRVVLGRALCVKAIIPASQEGNCANEDPLSLPALQTAINTPPRLKADGSACWYIKHIIEFQFEGKTFYRVVEDANPDQQCRVEWGTRFYTCDGELIGGTGNYPQCDDAAVCVYDIPTLIEAARAAGTIIWDSGIGQEEQFSDCSITITNKECRTIGIYDENDNLLASMGRGPYFGENFVSEWTDTRPLAAGGSRTYIFKTGNLYVGSATTSCENTTIDVDSKYFSGCTDALGIAKIKNIGCRTLGIYATNGTSLHQIAPQDSVFLSTGLSIYVFLADQDSLTVAAGNFPGANINTGGCSNSTSCTITITNNECRTVGIYDEADNFLTAMGGADPGPPPFSRPTQTWTDDRPLVANGTRTYIFKDGNLEIGRQTVTCDNPNINVVSKYFSGCTDAVGQSLLTNVGCRELQVFDTRGNLIESATQGENIFLQVLDRIYVVMAGLDTLQVGLSVGGDIDTKGCSENSPCLVAITNNECRTVGVYDEEDNIIITLAALPIPNSPLPQTPHRRIDPRPLAQGETRTYIFKENNFILGRQTVTCDNTEIAVVSNQFNACTDALFSYEVTNVGCRVIQVFNTSSELINSVSPEGVFQIKNRDISILIAGTDTLVVNSDNTVDSGGCGEEGGGNDNIFLDYPWLNDLGNQVSICPIKEVEVWQSGIYTYLLVTDDRGNETLYNENGQFYCQNSANYNCLTAYNLNNLVEQWACESIIPASECLVTITSKECRYLRIYDENDVLLTLKDGRPSSIRPNDKWEDPRPLASGETRTYVFKDGILELGRQIATCANPNIDLVNRYGDGCAEEFGPSELTNVGCNVLKAFNVGGGLLARALPGETLFLEGAKRFYILMANQDTLGVEYEYGVRDIDTGGCPDNTNYNNVQIFDDYPWLTDKVDRTNCSNERVEVWQARTTIFIWVEDENGNGTLYTENGQVQCQPAPSFPINCFQAYELQDLKAIWICGGSINPGEMEEETPNLAIFNDYPWLMDIVDPNNCSSEEVEIWRSGIYTYLLVTDAKGDGILYNQNGQLYCRNTSTYDCLAAYNLNEFVDLWICEANDCNCPQVVIPVCGVDGITYNNSCEAACAGVAVASEGGCNDCGTAGLLDFIECAPTLKEVAVYRYQGSNYVVHFPKNNTGPESEVFALFCNSINRFCEGGACNSLVAEGELIQVIYSTEGCPDDMENSDAIFNDYAWLTDIVDPNNCTNEKIEVYQSGIYIYLLVTSATGEANLYNQNGQFYCKNSSNYDCIAAYNLGTPIDTWTCSGTLPLPPLATCDIFRNVPSGTDLCDACYKDISVYEFRGESYIVYRAQTPDCRPLEIQVINCATNVGYCVAGPNIGLDGNCPTFWAEATLVETLWTDADCSNTNMSDCASNTGTIFFENCDNGVLYYFVRTDDGRVYDPYFDANITFTPIEGQRVNFDFVDASFPSPCSNAEKAITVTCIEKIDNPDADVDPIFSDFPWLSDIVNPTACNGERITVYESGTFQYVFIETATGASLYFEAGTFYCSDSPNYDCRAAYGLSQIADTWQCANLNLPASEERGNTAVDAPEFTAFPNPTTGRLTIQLGLPTENTQQLLVMDVLGRQLIQQEITPFTRTLEIDLSDYKNGVYYIELQASGQRLIQKMVKQGLE